MDECQIPIIAAFPKYEYITAPAALSYLWPSALKARIESGQARVIHVPFRKEPLADSVGQFTHLNMPANGLTYYSREAYEGWGYL